jgi:alginate O-acetyltransferase complex protein AlgI
MELFSVTFLAFLLGALGIYYLLPKIVRPFWLLICSYVFYLYDLAHIGFVALLASATLITWLAGLLLSYAQKTWLRRLIAFAAALACLIPLGYFKYAGFFTGVAQSISRAFGGQYTAPSLDLALPLGISYFTFAALGYVFDQYGRRYAPEKNPLYYALFVSFFPCIVTGPIERANHMLPQLRSRVAFDYNTFAGGVFRILYGFFKKLVMAGIIAKLLETVWKNPESYSGPILVIAGLLFTAELYFDFSSCSDIAIGAGACFGFTVMENFRRPLAAPSFKVLWDNWHISLTSWLEDYIFEPLAWNGWEKHIPLLGKKLEGTHPTVAALFLTYLVSGFWHGASWNYILWGLLNGLFLFIGNITRKKRKKLNKKNPLFTVRALAPLRRCLQTGFTYCLFSFTLVFFWVDLYAGGDVAAAFRVYGRMFADGWGQLAASLSALSVLGVTLELCVVLLAGVLLTNLIEMAKTPVNVMIRKVPIWLRWPLYYVLAAAILFYGAFGQSAFIYQQY